MSNDLIIRADGIVKCFDGGEVTALDGASLHIKREETVAVVGPSGSGKTTLLQILGTLRVPDEGELFFEGASYRTIADIAKFRRKTFGFVFQSPLLVPSLTAVENVILPLIGTEISLREMKEHAVEILTLAQSDHLANRRAANLSAGEKQRVSVCRAFVSKPKLVLADEPTANLDRGNRGTVLNLMTLFNQTFRTAIAVATHDPEVTAWAQRAVSLMDGRIEEADSA